MEIKLFSQLLIEDENKILFQRRSNTGYYDSYLTLPGGHLEQNESISDCVCRELKEELNLNISLADITLYSIIDRQNKDNTKRYVNFIFKLKSPINLDNIVNNEPDKCSEIIYCNKQNLPKDIIPYIKTVIEENLGFYHYEEED